MSAIKTIEDWSALFALAAQWEFDSMVRVTKNKLDQRASYIDKIVLGRKYPELECWLWKSFYIAARSNLPISREDLQKLDKDDIILILMGWDMHSSMYDQASDPNRIYKLMEEFVLLVRASSSNIFERHPSVKKGHLINQCDPYKCTINNGYPSGHLENI
jgi:hypothetical protein